MSLKDDRPDRNMSVQLRALWYDGKGDWHTAHNQVDHLGYVASARIHAYLHRKEGDIGMPIIGMLKPERKGHNYH